MDSNRRLAIAAGVFLIVATVTNVAGVAIASPVLNATDYLTRIATDQGSVLVSALLEFIGGVACTGIALALFPVLRPHNEGLALGSVVFRAIEGALYVLIAVCLLTLVALSGDAVNAGASGSGDFGAAAAVVMAARHGLGPVGVLTFGLGALMYYWVLYSSRLVPRWLSAWGLVGIVMVMASAALVMLRVIDSFSTPQIILAAPIGVQEMVLAVWLIAKGFSPAAVTGEPARERPILPAAA